MKRYDTLLTDDGMFSHDYLWESDEGGWVRYEDHEALLADATALLERCQLTGLPTVLANDIRKFQYRLSASPAQPAEPAVPDARESIARYLEHVAGVDVGTVISPETRELAGWVASWVRNRLDEKWARDAAGLPEPLCDQCGKPPNNHHPVCGKMAGPTLLERIEAEVGRAGVSVAHCANCDAPHCEITGKAMMRIADILRSARGGQ